MPRVILDLSALVLIRRAKLLRRLSGDMKRGQIAVAAYGLNRLKKNPNWLDWVQRNERLISVRPERDEEHTLFYDLLTAHGSVDSNPFIDDDDAMAIAIAKCRNWPLVMRDHAAEGVGRRLQVQLIAIEDFIRHLRSR